MGLNNLNAPKSVAAGQTRATAAIAALQTAVAALQAAGVLDDYVLTLTPDTSPSTGEGVEIVQAPTASAPVMRPKSNAGTADLDLRILGLGTGQVSINGSVPILKTIFDAKGDLIAGTGADTYAALTVGANGTVLIADSAASTGTRWGACPEGGYQDFAHPGTSQYEAWFAANCATHTAFATQALVANRMYALPFVAAGRNGCALDRLGINVTTGSAGNARLGIYNDSNGYPGTLLLDAGTVVTTNIAVVTATISQALTPGGRYWYAYVSNATPTVRSIPVNSCSHALGFGSTLGTAGNCGLYVAYAYAALPTPFPSTPTMITANPIPALFYRYSS